MTEAPQLIPRNEFRRIFDAEPMPQLVLTPTLTIVAANTAFLQATLKTREQLLGRKLFEVFPEKPGDDGTTGKCDLGVSLDHVLGSRTPHTVPVREYDVPDEEGIRHHRYWSIANVPLLDEQGNVIYIVLRIEDFTDWLSGATRTAATPDVLQERILRLERDMALRTHERQELALRLRSAGETQQQLNRAKDEFFGNISHELKTPLALVLGPVDDLLNAYPPLPEWQRLAVEMIRRNAAHLRKTITLLLDFSRALAGFPEARYEAVDLAAYTGGVASLLRAAIEGAGLQFVVACPPLPDLVYVDRSLWETIVLNLLSNALKFTLEGKIEISLRPHGDGVELAVRDTGCGISAHEQPHLFERLHIIAQSRGRTADGAGIGLALIRELVRLHGGSMRMESALGKGTSFFIDIPFGTAHLPPGQILRGASERVPSNAEAYVEEAIGWLSNASLRPPPPASKRRPRILLAEDSADMRDYMARVLGQLYEIEGVAEGRAALAAIEARPPDLLVTNVMMLGMDGVELVRALRADARHAALPIIMLSANSSEDARVAGIQAGANDYLAKPFSARELLARVAGLLAQGELIRNEQQLRNYAESDRQRLELVLESIRDGLLVVDHHWRIDLINSHAAGTLRQPRDDLLGRDFRQGVDLAVIEAVQQVMERRQPVSFEHFSNAGGRWCDYRLSPSPDGGVVVFFADITERKLAEERELLVAQHDALTGLSNRKLLREEAERILAGARRQGHKLAVLFLDLDHFKPINDTHGHEVGDKLLKAVAERIGRTLRAEDLVGRVGGDEFVAVLVAIADAEDVAHVANNIVEAVRRPYFINGLNLEISASVGISLFPMDGETVDILFKRADIAMYGAKRAGRSRFEFYRDGADMGNAPVVDPALAERLRAALAAGELSLTFQPVFSSATAAVVEAEAMIRWRQHDGSYVRPEDFLPVAETTGLIKPLGEWLLRAVCTQQRLWAADGVGDLAVAVKIAGVQFRQKDFAQQVAAIVRDTGIPPARLQLEIAESTALSNVDESVRVLKELRQVGVGVTIKNFGAGDSNVRALTRLPVDKFKVDRSFLQHGSGKGNGTHAAVDAIVGLGHSLHHEIVAEGIENEEDMIYVRNSGCEYFQGYHLANPMSPSEFAEWWSRHAKANGKRQVDP
ncbi:MAG: EAL domain-containing protein [Rhodocyclaceae bacterium]|nr:EAL domain-containing protein [Rhodocyclaceae bacterium]